VDLASSSLTLFLLLTSVPLAAQQTPPQPATPQPSAPATSTIEIDLPLEVDVDGECRIITLDKRHPARPKLRHHTDKNVLVEVREHEFVLQNPYPQPVTYIVHQPITKHYHIDSEPQPADITDSVATFRVLVPPGQTSRLHVGERD